MWITALVIGFAGSLHCLGMCSPLALSVTSLRPSAAFNRFLYNAGRIATYATMGALVSGVGYLLPLHKFQNLISIALGILLLTVGLGGLHNLHIPRLTSVMQRITSLLKALFAFELAKKNRGAMIILGALNGLLPCGLSLIALGYCLTLKGPLDGFNFMLLFGVGTLPVMLGLTGILPAVVKKLNWDIHSVITSLIILSGLVLIIRVFVVHLPHAESLSEGFVDIVLCR